MKIKFAITALCAALLTGCGVAIKSVGAFLPMGIYVKNQAKYAPLSTIQSKNSSLAIER